MKNYPEHKGPALWITATLAAAAVVPAVIILRKARKTMGDPFDLPLLVSEITYQAPFYSFTYTVENAPLFYFSSGLELQVNHDLLAASEERDWTQVGVMEDFVLTASNFDGLFFTGRSREFASLRKRNRRSWRLDVEAEAKAAFYYLLQQKNGDVYLAYGYHTDGTEKPDSQASIIRWLFRLSPAHN